MSIKEDLERLKVLDPKTYDSIMLFHLNTVHYGNGLRSGIDDMSLDIIQGEIQRAVSRRGWLLTMHFNDGCVQAVLVDRSITRYVDSPAEAILAAYIAALEAEAKR